MIRLEIGILGSRWWWRHGLIHRLNGPAYMDNTGYQGPNKLKSPFMVNSILDTTISIKDLSSP